MNDLERFLSAQEPVYPRVLRELRDGRKESHWMWFIFPQLQGLGHSPTARHYAIRSLEEAREYLAHPVLGARLAECAEILLALPGSDAGAIFGYPDELKLKSSMTLFSLAAVAHSPFEQVLTKFYGGARDLRTLELLGM